MTALARNRVLGDRRAAPADRRHRIVLSNWPTMTDDPRSASFEAIARHAGSSGYDGFEFDVATFRRYFPGATDAQWVSRAGRALRQANLANPGVTVLLGDAALRDLHFKRIALEKIQPIADLGGEYASYQLFLHDEHQGTGGAYRRDEDYLRFVADRIAKLREWTWDLGLNFYLEIHVGRVTEDPAALVRLMELSPCELTGDLSHFIFRGVLRGPYLEKLLPRVGHAHLRISRVYGDLSAVVEDPAADWAAGGATWRLFEQMKPALAGGLSSRTLTGESGPMHLVSDPLSQDVRMLPLWRAMARYADAAAQGIAIPADSPSDLKPWG